jgi:hypothetical protein
MDIAAGPACPKSATSGRQRPYSTNINLKPNLEIRANHSVAQIKFKSNLAAKYWSVVATDDFGTIKNARLHC